MEVTKMSKKLKRETTMELMKAIQEITVSAGDYAKGNEIMDYFFASDYNAVPVSNYEFDLCTDVRFGSNEGIYLGIYIDGLFEENQNESRLLRIGGYKTLNTDLEAMKIMGELGGVIVYHGRNYINSHLDRFSPAKELVYEGKLVDGVLTEKYRD